MTTIHSRKLQQYTQDNTTIHTKQLQYTQDNYNNTHKTTTTTHTRQLQQYTQGNYNNAQKTTTTHKITTTIHTRQLQQYTQDNYNNTHKTTTTIHTRQLQQYSKYAAVWTDSKGYNGEKVAKLMLELNSKCWNARCKGNCWALRRARDLCGYETWSLTLRD